jgi:hypothetical protein
LIAPSLPATTRSRRWSMSSARWAIARALCIRSWMVKAVDGRKLGSLIDNADRFSAALAAASPDVQAGRGSG